MGVVLRWLADGQQVQLYELGHHPADDPLHQQARWVDAIPDTVLRSIIERRRPIEHYRLAPTTFVLNGKEIGFPMTPGQAAAHTDIAYVPSLAGEHDFITLVDHNSDMFKKVLKQRMLFANKADAIKVSKALQEILYAAIGCRS